MFCMLLYLFGHCFQLDFTLSYAQMIYLRIISRVRVGYDREMVDSQLGATRLVGYNHLMIIFKREWNKCFIKYAHNISRILPDFICKNSRFIAWILTLSRRVHLPYLEIMV